MVAQDPPIEARIFGGQGVVAGIPDVIIVHEGKTYGLELKAAGGRLLPDIAVDRTYPSGMPFEAFANTSLRRSGEQRASA
jgi:hypothetical protein